MLVGRVALLAALFAPAANAALVAAPFVTRVTSPACRSPAPSLQFDFFKLPELPKPAEKKAEPEKADEPERATNVFGKGLFGSMMCATHAPRMKQRACSTHTTHRAPTPAQVAAAAATAAASPRQVEIYEEGAGGTAGRTGPLGRGRILRIVHGRRRRRGLDGRCAQEAGTPTPGRRGTTKEPSSLPRAPTSPPWP